MRCGAKARGLHSVTGFLTYAGEGGCTEQRRRRRQSGDKSESSRKEGVKTLSKKGNQIRCFFTHRKIAGREPNRMSIFICSSNAGQEKRSATGREDNCGIDIPEGGKLAEAKSSVKEKMEPSTSGPQGGPEAEVIFFLTIEEAFVTSRYTEKIFRIDPGG